MTDFNYDSATDILTVDREGRSPEDYDRSRPIGEYVIDLNSKDEVIGLEVLNASQNLPFTKSELENIEDVSLDSMERGEGTTISVNVTYSGNKGKFSLGYGTAEA